MIYIDIKENIYKYQDAIIVDITNTNEKNEFRKLSPLYSHGDIPLPNTTNICSKSINEVWQRLCINGKNESSYYNVRFRKGIGINDFWDYIDARKNILIPIYCWMLENKAYDIVENLRSVPSAKTVVIIDKTINSDINNLREPFSCAFLLKSYIEGTGPYKDAIVEIEECVYNMVGRKDVCYKKIKRVAKKIAKVYTDPQRILEL